MRALACCRWVFACAASLTACNAFSSIDRPEDWSVEPPGAGAGGSMAGGGTDSGGADADEAGAGGSGCAPDETLCAGDCVNTDHNPDHCGGCKAACKASEVCSSGSCKLGCPSGLTNCAGACINTSTDPAHCGQCGKACGAGQVCAASVCTLTCATGTTNCGTVCANTTDDPSNCGNCGKVCAGNTSCINSVCASCTPGAVDTQACGKCGTQSRSCGSQGEWGAFGTCSGEGACAPGATQNAPCGNCGTRVQTCDATCTWTDGACTGEGTCSPGAQVDCLCGFRYVCKTDCEWKQDITLLNCDACAKPASCIPPGGPVKLGVAFCYGKEACCSGNSAGSEPCEMTCQ